MIQSIYLFIKQILNLGNFCSKKIPKSVYSELLTAFSNIKNKDVIVIPQLIEKFCKGDWTLIVDETINSKYGLKHITRKLKILNNGGYCFGYKVVLFLLNKEDLVIPIGFGFYHKDSESISEITINFLGRLRNEFQVRPEIFVADGAYDVDKLVKLITDYGWACIIRCRSSRTLSKVKVKKLIPRGYGEAKGELKNKTKVKIFRRKERFFIGNRMLMSMKKAVEYYTRRWLIEEMFRFLKSCIGIKRCQQHRTIFQEIFIWMCLMALAYFSYQSMISGDTMYKCFNNVIFANNDFDLALLKKVLGMS